MQYPLPWRRHCEHRRTVAPGSQRRWRFTLVFHRGVVLGGSSRLGKQDRNQDPLTSAPDAPN
jgi:hypothetical protein